MYKNKDWLQRKYINEKLSSVKIGKLCNVGGLSVRFFLRKYNIPIRSISEATHLGKANHCNLSEEAIGWINGEIMGDGHLELQSAYSARFMYSSKYFEYIQYVSDTLKSFGIEQSGKIIKRKDKKLGNITYNYHSYCYVELLSIHKQWYPEGKKIIPKDIKLTPLTLRQYFIGDGCLLKPKHRSPYIKLSSYGFSISDIERYISKLKIMGINASRWSSNQIHISTYSTKDFFNYIGKCPVNCYQYKWNYKGIKVNN